MLKIKTFLKKHITMGNLMVVVALIELAMIPGAGWAMDAILIILWGIFPDWTRKIIFFLVLFLTAFLTGMYFLIF